jgi:hemoglobin-like flavoprotein
LIFNTLRPGIFFLQAIPVEFCINQLIMTEQQIAIVKRTWKLFREIDPVVVGDTFYSKLFSDHPALRRMFPKDMDAQYRKLMDMLNTIVARLEKIEELTGEIGRMAERHMGYDVKPIHFTWVGNALMWTLRQGLGSDWNEKVGEAWTVCYTKVSTAMIKSFSSSSSSTIAR